MTRLILVQPLVSSSQRCGCKVQSFASCQITQCTSGALWVYWTWQVKVGRVGRCQVSPMRSVIQVLCLINKIWNIEIELEQSRFENDRTISFIPPDGEFELMSYRLNTHVKVCRTRLEKLSSKIFHPQPLIWIESVIERHAHSRIEIMVKAKSQFKRRLALN